MNNGKKNWTNIRHAMREAISRWIYDPNVSLIDYGWRERGGKLIENEDCIRVHVIKKLTSTPMLEAAIMDGTTRGPIPGSIGGIPVDIPHGVYRLHQWWGGGYQKPADQRAERNAPMRGGISVANARVKGYGTLGGPVINRDTGAKMILSNWHVLYAYWDVRAGWPVYQPGRGDGGSRDDTVAKLSHHAMGSNLDAAVAELTGERQLINEQLGLGPVKGMSWAYPGMEVIKSGRRTRITHGRVTGVEGVSKMNYRGVKRLIRNVITIFPRLALEVSAGGDSGSFWLEEETMNVVGLHFAGGDYPERALAIDIKPILDELNVDLDLA